jgi:formate/nitrite transporter FocA (FNT family)
VFFPVSSPEENSCVVILNARLLLNLMLVCSTTYDKRQATSAVLYSSLVVATGNVTGTVRMYLMAVSLAMVMG